MKETLEEKTDMLRRALKDNKPKQEVKKVYGDYVDKYKEIRVPKVIHMLEFRELFFKYHEYMERRNEKGKFK